MVTVYINRWGIKTPRNFHFFSKKLDEISLAIDSLNLLVDKTASEQGLNIELLREEKKNRNKCIKKQGSEPIYGPLPLSFTYAVTGL